MIENGYHLDNDYMSREVWLCSQTPLYIGREYGGNAYSGGDEGGQGDSVEYRANVLLVAFNSLHLRGLRQSCSTSQILFVLNLYMDKE